MTSQNDFALRPGPKQRADLGEVMFETARRDDFQNARRRITWVPEGVRHAPRLDDEVTGPSNDRASTDLGADLTLEDVGELVFVPVRVYRAAQRPWGKGMHQHRRRSAPGEQ